MLQLNIINRQHSRRLSGTFDQMLSRNGKEVCWTCWKLMPKWGRYDELIAAEINGNSSYALS